jgi:L-seryl-tRNA(Ser) seleniumtransferase
MSEGRQRRAIPAVEKLLVELSDLPLPRPMLTTLVRRELQALRDSGEPPPPFGQVAASIRAAAQRLHASRIRPVINGTGVIIHTNLGRAPLGRDVVARLAEVAAGYNNLEFDLAGGGRGERAGFLEQGLALLCGAEAATVVNNCAAALVLILRHFTAGDRRQVIISRGELVEIGGGFRIPEILETSGAELREVGTTNRTTLEDYRRAIGPATALILKVHQSNFNISGFVAAPSAGELRGLAAEHRLPFVQDLGSGAVAHTDSLAPVDHEPTPAEMLAQGIELLCFSGDKLLGGPQAGVIAGRAEYVAALKKNPFFRALRCDRLVLTALQETVTEYLHAGGPGTGTPAGVPVLALLELDREGLRRRAGQLADRLADAGLPLEIRVGTGESRLGGGTMPGSSIPSVTLDLRPRATSPKRLARRLRHGDPPVIAYIADDTVKLDLRTVFPQQDETLATAIRQAAR